MLLRPLKKCLSKPGFGIFVSLLRFVLNSNSKNRCILAIFVYSTPHMYWYIQSTMYWSLILPPIQKNCLKMHISKYVFMFKFAHFKTNIHNNSFHLETLWGLSAKVVKLVYVIFLMKRTWLFLWSWLADIRPFFRTDSYFLLVALSERTCLHEHG
jgi:hypothetical protein